jgi:hypothetical protein
LLGRSFAGRTFEGGHFKEANGQGASGLEGGTVEGNQEGDLEEAETQHQVEAKLGGEWIALEKSAEDPASGLVQTGVIHGDTNETAVAKRASFMENGLEQSLSFPGRPGMEAVVGRPIQELTALGPKSAGQSAASERREGAQSLGEGAAKGTRLSESGPPSGGDVQPISEQHRPPVSHHNR